MTTGQTPPIADPWHGSALMIATGLLTAALLTYILAEPTAHPIHDGLLFAAGLGFAVGLVSKAAGWVVERLHGPMERLASEAHHGTQIAGRLMASRTVDLNAYREELRATREYVDAATEGVVKKLNERFDEVLAKIAKLDGEPADVVELEDLRLLKRLEEKVRKKDQPEH